MLFPILSLSVSLCLSLSPSLSLTSGCVPWAGPRWWPCPPPDPRLASAAPRFRGPGRWSAPGASGLRRPARGPRWSPTPRPWAPSPSDTLSLSLSLSVPQWVCVPRPQPGPEKGRVEGQVHPSASRQGSQGCAGVLASPEQGTKEVQRPDHSLMRGEHSSLLRQNYSCGERKK